MGTIPLLVCLLVWKPLRANVLHATVPLVQQRENTVYLLSHYRALFLMSLHSKAAKAPKQRTV